MNLRNVALMLSLALVSLSASAANGFGAAPAAGANGAAAVAIVQPFEPWVKTARIGDFVIIKYKDGKTVRKTVKALEISAVVLEFSSADAKPSEQKFSRDEKTQAPPQELDLVKSGSSALKIGTQTVQADVLDGFIVGMRAMHSSITPGKKTDNQESFKVLKYQKIVAQGIPFGGVVKVMQAPDDGKPILFGKGQKTGRIDNEIEKLELMYEVTEFGAGK
jgi:hypothetical protein